MKSFTDAVITYFAIVIYLKCINCQRLPTNPCPDLFKYLESNGVIFGRLEFPNDYSGQYRLSVNMSLATLLSGNKNIDLKLKTTTSQLQQGNAVVYDINFPIQNVLPKPTRIEFNENVYCTGPPEEVRPGKSGVTNMWASTYKGVTITSRPKEPSITQNNRHSNPSAAFPGNPFLASVTSVSPRLSTTTTIRPIRTTTRRPTTTTTTTTTERPTTRSTTRRTTTRTTTTPAPKQQCGLSTNVQQLIVNGDSIEKGQYPWITAILYRQDSNYKYGCSGSLVSNLHVVTAAHCVLYFKALLFPVEDLITVFGKINIRNWANEAVLRDVESVIAHPDYKQQKGDGDIAILKLKEAVDFQTSIRPVCLWQESDDLDVIVGKEGTVVGWGRDETGNDFVPEAKRINLPIVAQITCLRLDPRFIEITSTRTFCAGTLNNSGPCTGDSGAGYVMYVDGRWTLRGVVSTALRDTATCDLTKYSVFADVAKFKDWLINAMDK